MAFTHVAFRMRWLGGLAVAGVLVLATLVAMGTGASPVTVASSAPVAQEKVGSSLASLAADRPTRRTEVIVRMAPGQRPATGRALVARAGGKPISRDLSIINGFAARMRAGDAARIARDSRVQAISLNGGARIQGLGDEPQAAYECPSSDATAVRTNAPTVRGEDDDDDDGDEGSTSVRSSLKRLEGAALHSMEVDAAWKRASGSRVGVAVVDTGIAGDLPDFRVKRSRTDSRVIASAVTNPCATDAADNYGHGTHVAGLIAGNSLMHRSKDPAYGRYMGAAPKANLVSVKVADEDGRTTVLDVINGLQFVVDHKNAFKIRVVNLSLSSTVAESYRTDPLAAAAEQAWFKGIVVVAAAGNDGSARDAVSYAPANDPYVISVGSVDDRGTHSIRDDQLASWSSRGVTQDGVRKPEVLAPGTRLTSTLSPGSDLVDMCPTCVKRGRYFQMGGTSMSAALVSGAVAALLEERPDLTPNQVKYALQSTLRDVPGTGAEIDAYAAMRAPKRSANAGLEPNVAIDASTGLIDFTRASFRRASFRDAGGSGLAASFTRASFRCDCGLLESGAIDPARASFRRASFRETIGFGK